MTENKYINMDSYIMLSLVNMKLRDSFSSLEAFCEDEGISPELVIKKLEAIGYNYVRDINQFR